MCSLSQVVQEPLDHILPCYSALHLLYTELLLLLSFGSHGMDVGEAAIGVDSGHHNIVVRVSFGRGCGLEVYDYVAHINSVCLLGKYGVYALASHLHGSQPHRRTCETFHLYACWRRCSLWLVCCRLRKSMIDGRYHGAHHARRRLGLLPAGALPFFSPLAR